MDYIIGILFIFLSASWCYYDALDTIKKDVGKEYRWPGNVRKLEQATRRILLNGHYTGDTAIKTDNTKLSLLGNINDGTLDATELLTGYCKMLYTRHPTYGEVARRTGLDWRTVKKCVTPNI